MGYIFLFLSKLCGVGKVVAMKKCGSIAGGVRNSVYINSLRTVICLVVSIAVWLFASPTGANTVGNVSALLGGVGTAVQLITWILAAQKISTCFLEVFCMLGSVALPLLIAPYLYDGDKVSILQWVGVLLLIASVFMFSGGKKEKKKLDFVGIITIVLASLGGGLASVASKYYMAYGEGDASYYTMSSYVYAIAVFLIVMVYFGLKDRKKDPDHREDYGFKSLFSKPRVLIAIVFAAVFLYACTYLQTIASGMLPSGIVYPLSYAFSLPLIFFADVFIFKEKIRIGNVLGLVTVIIASIFVTL